MGGKGEFYRLSATPEDSLRNATETEQPGVGFPWQHNYDKEIMLSKTAVSKTAESKKQRHLRATPEQVFEKWKRGFYTPKGYLHDLIQSLRKEGWWFRIENVEEFCKQWEINRRTFYRAKAELTAEGFMEEKIIGIVELRLSPMRATTDELVTNPALPVTNPALPVTNPALPVTNPALPVTNLAQSIAESGCVSDFHGSHRSYSDLSHLNTTFPQEIESHAEACHTLAPVTEEDFSKPSNQGKTESVNPNPVDLGSVKNTHGGEGNFSARRSKRKTKSEPDCFRDEFEQWWKQYREFCLTVDCEPGKRSEAVSSWDEILKREPDVLQVVLEGTECYAENKLKQFQAKGEAIGVSHGFRYLRDRKWQDALDRKKISLPERSNPYVLTEEDLEIVKANLAKKGLDFKC